MIRQLAVAVFRGWLQPLGTAAVFNLRLDRRPRWRRLERVWWVSKKLLPRVGRYHVSMLHNVVAAYRRAWRNEIESVS